MQELYSQCREYIIETGRFPYKDEKYTVLDKVYDKIEERDIWIPYTEVYQHFKVNPFVKTIFQKI